MRALVILAALLVVGPALADDPPAPDLVGVYFDEDAVTNVLDAETMQPFFVYVVLNNPSGPNIQALEYSYLLTVPPGLENQVFQLASGTCSFAGCNPDDGTTPLQGDLIFGFAAPCQVAPATLIHVWQYLFLSPMSVQFRLGPSSHGNMLYQSDGELIPMHPVSGDPDLPLAFATVTDPVAAESSTFGALKALYR
jgi:hypothetical protein